jgi:hypothetical protein
MKHILWRKTSRTMSAAALIALSLTFAPPSLAHIIAEKTHAGVELPDRDSIEKSGDCLLLVDEDYERLMNRAQSKRVVSHFREESNSSVILNTGRVYHFRLATLVAPEYLDVWFPEYSGHAAEHKEEIRQAVRAWWNTLEATLNGLYREQVGISFSIVRDDRLILFDYADVAGVGSQDARQALDMMACRPYIEKLIGANDVYDLGIVIGNPQYGRAGAAALGSALGYSKGSAISVAAPTTIAHEIGHCFGAEHTHQRDDSNCTEPGMGTSVMSYGSPRDFFALSSIRQMRAVLGNINYYTDEARTQLVKVQEDENVNRPCAYEEQGAAPQLDRERIRSEYSVTLGSNFQFPLPVTTHDYKNYYYCVNPYDVALGPSNSNPLRPAYQEAQDSIVCFEPHYIDPKNVSGNVIVDPFSGDSRLGTYTFLAAVRNHSNYDSKTIRLNIVEGEPFKISHVDVVSNIWNKSIGRNCSLYWNPCTDLYGKDSRVRILLSDDCGKTYKYVLADGVPNSGECTVILPYINIGTGNFHDWSITENGGRLKIEVIGEAAYAIYPEEPYTYVASVPESSVSNAFTLTTKEQQYAFRTEDNSPLPPVMMKVESISDIPAKASLIAFRNKNTSMTYPVNSVTDEVMGAVVRRSYAANCGGTVYTYTQIFQLPDVLSDKEKLSYEVSRLEPMARELYNHIGQLGYPLEQLPLSSTFKTAYAKVFSADGVKAEATSDDVKALKAVLTSLTAISDADIVKPQHGHTYKVRFYLSPYGRDKYIYLAEDGENGQYFTEDVSKAANWTCEVKDGKYHFNGSMGHEMFDDYVPAGQTTHNLVFDNFTNTGYAFTFERGYSWGAFSLINASGYGCMISVGGQFSILRGPNNVAMVPEQRCNCNDGVIVSTDLQLVDVTYSQQPETVAEGKYRLAMYGLTVNGTARDIYAYDENNGGDATLGNLGWHDFSNMDDQSAFIFTKADDGWYVQNDRTGNYVGTADQQGRVTMSTTPVKQYFTLRQDEETLDTWWEWTAEGASQPYVLDAEENAQQASDGHICSKAVAATAAKWRLEPVSKELRERERFFVPDTKNDVTMYRQLYAGLNTVCMPFALTTDMIPVSGARIYAYKSSDGTSAYFDEVTGVEAGQPCLVELPAGTETKEYTITIPAGTTYVTTPQSSNGIIGTFKNISFNADNYYKLATVDGVDKFVRTTSASTLYAFRFGLSVDASGASKSLTIVLGGEPTGIGTATEKTNVEAVYGVDGVRLAAPRKGINIVKLSNGKTCKVLVK